MNLRSSLAVFLYLFFLNISLVLVAVCTIGQDTAAGQATKAPAATNTQSDQAAGPVQEITVTAKKYEFAPNPIRVKKGLPVRLIITAVDHDHGFKLEAFHIEKRLKKGTAETVEFIPDKAGTFPFKCSVVCGVHHGRMKGTLVVED